MDTLHSLNFSWPTTDVLRIRRDYLNARRIYRVSGSGSRALTQSAFTERAFQVGSHRHAEWLDSLLQDGQPTDRPPREQIALTWRRAVIDELDDTWDDLAQMALRSPGQPVRRRIWKSDVARLAVLNGLTDWSGWVTECRNDTRRVARGRG